jgi:fructose-1,6-bisphosphatase/inositol monophosphatase family enzyme
MIKSPELQTAIGVGWRMGNVMHHYYSSEEELDESTKDDGSIVTYADEEISDWVVAFYAQYGRGVVSEERGRSAEYGSLDAEYLDPIDGTKNFSQARRLGAQSIAGFSLGSVEHGLIVRGVVNFPLMAYPRLYWAEAGRGAYRVEEEGGFEVPLAVDRQPTRGAVLVSDTYDLFNEPLEAQGFRPIHLAGAVFKACAVADPHLLYDFDSTLLHPSERVVGFLSHRASAHDYVGAAAIVRAAGGVACDLNGGELSLQAGKHGCIVTNNETTRDRLIEIAQAGLS